MNPPQEIHELFELYFKLMTMRRDKPRDMSQQIYDMLNLVEAYYKVSLSIMFGNLAELTEEEKQEKDEYVLDAELFTREGRHFTKSDVFKRQ